MQKYAKKHYVFDFSGKVLYAGDHDCLQILDAYRQMYKRVPEWDVENGLFVLQTPASEELKHEFYTLTALDTLAGLGK